MRRAAYAMILLGCTHPAPSDEARVRAELHLPPTAILQGLDARPLHGGTFGREGLRIHAVFEFPPGAVFAEGPQWRALPLPQSVWSFGDPPEELRAIGGAARALCYVTVMHSNSNAVAGRVDCAEAPPNFSQYRVAIYRPETRTLSVVFKNNY